MDIFKSNRPTKLSPFRFQIALLLTALTGFSLLYGPGTHPAKPVPPHDPMVLIASANDPLMIQAIKYARGAGQNHTGGSNVWAKPKSDGSTATFTTPAGSITLTSAEIAEANFVYPQLKQRARDGHHNRSTNSSADEGFNLGDNAGEFGEQSQ